MNSPANFHCLKSRLRLTGVLEMRTALHIGTSDAIESVLDMPVLRDAAGFPFIPGASLKGVVRSTIEALLRAHRAAIGDARALARHVWACDPTGKAEHGCGKRNDQDLREAEVIANEHCAACRLFGSRWLASHTRFSDLHPVERPASGPPIEVRDGVAIDRDLRTVSGGQKYDFEVVRPGTAFVAEVFVENPEDWLMGLLMIGFDQIDAGFTAIGGFTSRGLGRARFVWKTIETVTTQQLLDGKEPESVEGAAIEAKKKLWRDALAAHVRT